MLAHVDAYQYLVLLHLACDQIALGTDQADALQSGSAPLLLSMPLSGNWMPKLDESMWFGNS